MPGLTYTPMLDSWFLKTARTQAGSDDPKPGHEHISKNVVHKTIDRPGQPKDIAAAVVFLGLYAIEAIDALRTYQELRARGELTARVEPGYWETRGYDVDGWVGHSNGRDDAPTS